MNRRRWLQALSLALGASARPKNMRALARLQQGPTAPLDSSGAPLALVDYEPKSMLNVKKTRVERARFPVIDVHTHISVSAKSDNGVDVAAERTYLGQPSELLAVMDRKNLRTLVNLTGGFEDGLTEVVGKYDKAFPGRFFSFAEPSYSRFLDPNYPRIQADA